MNSDKSTILEDFLRLRKVKPEQALSLLMDKYGDVMNGIVSNILKKDSLTEEAVQDGFIKVWKNLSEYDQNKSSLFTWLLTIFKNTAIDHLRKESKRQIQSLDSSVYDNMKYSENTNMFDPGLLQKINSMDPKYRELVDLIYLQGFTQQEVCDELSIPLGTVKTRISTGIKMLRDILNILIISLFVNF
ncbi:MAG: sigma-70 family RNA polymerase sigma factor [Saprospiraceae bacterium]|nr:sigma-70 family RNA polymerase sigma factor [Saprospiraceae bacterium]